MHGTVGGQLEEMARLAVTFRTNADGVRHIRGAVENVLSQTMWTGPAANRFREAWQQFAPSLERLHEALTEAGAEVDRRRLALDTATR